MVILHGKDEQIFNESPESVDLELITKITLGGPDLIRQKPLKNGLGPSVRSETLSSHFEERSAYEFYSLK